MRLSGVALRRSLRRRLCAAALGILAHGLVAPRAGAQGAEILVQAGSTLERDSVTVGQLVRLTVRVRAPLGASINFPAAVDSLGPVQSLEPPVVRNGADSAAAADRIAIYRLAAWDVGTLRIVLGDVLVQTDVAERRVALALPSIVVTSVLPADSTLRVPKPARALIPAQVPVPWWWWVVGAVAALLLGLGVWWWSRRRRGSAGATHDPYAEAQADFTRVDQLALVDTGEPGRHAALMSDVVRRYLAGRFAAASLSNTSGELLDAVRGAPTLSFDALRQLLDAVDPVKFGATPIDGVRARALGEAAREIVRDEHARATALAAQAARDTDAAAPSERAA